MNKSKSRSEQIERETYLLCFYTLELLKKEEFYSDQEIFSCCSKLIQAILKFIMIISCSEVSDNFCQCYECKARFVNSRNKQNLEEVLEEVFCISVEQ